MTIYRLKNIVIGSVLLLMTVIIGTSGYMIIEGAGFINAMYMTVITITSVGYGEVFPMSEMGRVFTIFVILMGVGTVAYTATQVIELVVAGEIRRTFTKRVMDKKMKKIKDHYIICGYGRMGRIIAERLNGLVDFVIVDKLGKNIIELESKDYLYVEGDATKEITLEKAGIMNAKGLISVVNTDSENVYIVLTAKGFKKDLYVVTRASDDEAINKMKRAGADKVFSPYLIGGLSIANTILKPNVSEFLDLALGKNSFHVDVIESKIVESSFLCNKKIVESNIRKIGIIIIAIRRENGEFIYNPGPDVTILCGDTIIGLGKIDDCEKFNAAQRGENVAF